MNKECGMLQVENGVLYVAPLADIQINWGHVSLAFRAQFIATLQNAQETLLSAIEANRGLNIIYQLERIGNLINQGHVSKEDSFSIIWEREVQATLEELEIA